MLPLQRHSYEEVCILDELLKRYPILCNCSDDINNAVNTIISCYNNDGKLLLCGNGGSSTDCDHITGELMKGFLKKRPVSDKKRQEMKCKCNFISDDIINSLQGGLPAISLSSLTALNTAFCNDVEPKMMFAQAVFGLAQKNDILIAISTSGNSENVVCAAIVAKSMGIKVISLTGKTGGILKDFADISICVGEEETFKIQELHLPVYHYICSAVENYFYDE